MGTVWLDGRTAGYPNVLDVLRAAGVSCSGYAGWEHNSRSSGGFEGAVYGVVCHHTASQTSPANDLNYMVTGPDNPISNGLLDRTGHFTCIAGGASNHAGKGGGSDGAPPWTTSRGTIPQDSANSRCFGIEAANNGVGEPWPKAQQDAYARMCNALAGAYGLVVATDFRSHFEWTTRKCDPTGASRWTPIGNRLGCNGADRWDMNLFRNEVAGTLPAPIPPSGDDEQMLTIFEPTDAGAVFIGFCSRGFGHTISWISNSGTLDTYRANGFPTQKITVADCKGLWLVGDVPVGDHRHNWTAADFAP